MTMWLYLRWQSSDRTETQSRSWQRVRFISALAWYESAKKRVHPKNYGDHKDPAPRKSDIQLKTLNQKHSRLLWVSFVTGKLWQIDFDLLGWNPRAKSKLIWFCREFVAGVGCMQVWLQCGRNCRTAGGGIAGAGRTRENYADPTI